MVHQVALREHSRCKVSIFTYLLAKIAVDIPHLAMEVVLLAIIFIPTVKLNTSGQLSILPYPHFTKPLHVCYMFLKSRHCFWLVCHNGNGVQSAHPSCHRDGVAASIMCLVMCPMIICLHGMQSKCLSRSCFQGWGYCGRSPRIKLAMQTLLNVQLTAWPILSVLPG